MNSKEQLMLLLCYVPGIGGRKTDYVLELVSSIEELKDQFDDLTKRMPLDNKLAENFKKIMNNFCVEETILKYREKKVDIITKDNEKYPRNLKEIYDPPPILFCKGDLQLLKNKSLAIVGARKATWYGKNTAQEMGEYLSFNEFTVTSGMARGIDASAHLGALKGKGKSIGVLGCGLDIIYPKQNKDIYLKMEQEGLLVSTYPLGTQPVAGHFPARNRVISGLSQGVIVIEAEERSGALITVDFAMEQGRDVFAVPGNINSVMSRGTNKLIKDGAIVVTKYSDIMEEYSYYEVDGENKLPSIPQVNLSDIEKLILKNSQGQSVSLEYLLLTTGIDISQLLANLITLEIKGLIKKAGNQTYQPLGKVDF